MDAVLNSVIAGDPVQIGPYRLRRVVSRHVEGRNGSEQEWRRSQIWAGHRAPRCSRSHLDHHSRCMSSDSSKSSSSMSTPILIGVGAIAAAVAGRSLMRRGLLGGKNAAEQWVKGGFKAKMDRKEALQILGLK